MPANGKVHFQLKLKISKVYRWTTAHHVGSHPCLLYSPIEAGYKPKIKFIGKITLNSNLSASLYKRMFDVRLVVYEDVKLVV